MPRSASASTCKLNWQIAFAYHTKVFIRGEYWNARADQAIVSGDPVEVESVDGLVLRVRRAESAR